MNKADKHLYPTQTSASMSPNTFRPPTLTFNPSIFPLFLFPSSLPLYMAATGGALLFVAGAGKGRSGLHLSFASCYHFSHLCTHPAPSLPVFLLTPPIPPILCLFAFDIQQSVWSETRKGEGGTHARHWTSDPSTRWTFSCRLPISSDTPPVCFRYSNTGFFAVARTGTQGLKKQHRWTRYKSFVTSEICLLYGSDFVSQPVFAFTNRKDAPSAALPAPQKEKNLPLRS